MTNEAAMEYLSDIMNVYLSFIPVTRRTQYEIKEALSLGIGALKTIDDMHKDGFFITTSKGEQHDPPRIDE